MARFIVSPDTPDSWAIPLKTGVNTVGRGDGNDAVINHPSISGRHCEIVVSADVVRLKDLGSTNGTFINRAPVTEAILQPGQRIQLGAVELLFEADATTPAPRTPIAIRVRPQPVPTAMALPASDGLALAGQPHAPPPAAGGWESASSAAEGPPVREATDPGHALCKYHPRTSAHWLCPNCHKTYCDLCVATRPGAVTQRFCKSCGAVCTELQVRIEIPAQKSFFRELPRSILYPFRGTGILILLVATVLFAALDFLSRGLIGLLMKAVALGYLFSYVQNIIHSTANDDDKLPDLPGMDDVLGGCFRLMGTVLISFGPAGVLAYLAIAQEQPAAGIALIPAVIFGCVYFPMAFLAVAIKDTVIAANPLVVVPSILRVPLEYLVTAILLAGLFGIRWIGDALSGGVARQSLMTTSMTEMFLLFGFRAVWAFVSVYLLTVTMRILGLLYLTKRERLGW